MRFAIRSSVFLFVFLGLCSLAQPVITADQTRYILSNASNGTNVGIPILVTDDGDAIVAWQVLGQTNPALAGIGANEIFFDIDEDGQVTVFKPLTNFTPPGGASQVSATLNVRVYDASGDTHDENITIVISKAVVVPVITANQVRNVLVTAAVGSAVENPLIATGNPDSWQVISQNNGAAANVDADEIFFEISTGGQLSVKQELTRFFAEFRNMSRGDSLTVTVTVRAYANGEASADETITINIEEGNTPRVLGSQSFNILSTDAPDTAIGTIQTIGNPTNFAIVGSAGMPGGVNANGFFAIAPNGNLTVGSWLDQLAWVDVPTTVTLSIEASNIFETSPPVDITIYVTPAISGRCGYIPFEQTRYISSVASTGEGAGFPIHTVNIDSIWIDAAWIGGTTAPFEDVSTYFTIETNGGTFGQITVVRDLSAFFDPEQITFVAFQVIGFAPVDGCSNQYVSETVYLYVLPADAGDTGADDGDADGGDDGTGVDFFNYITDDNLASCIRNTLGLIGTQSLSAGDVRGLENLNCGCIAGGTPAIANLSGLHLFTGLTTLNLSNNTVSDIKPLSNLTNLTDLRLSGNLISDITTSNPLASLVNLVTLDLSANQIEDTNAFSTLASLNFLDLSNNEICDIASLIPLVENGILTQGDTVDLENNHLLNVEAQSQIAALQSAGVFVTTAGNDACPAAIVPLALEDWPSVNIQDFADYMSVRSAPCN